MPMDRLVKAALLIPDQRRRKEILRKQGGVNLRLMRRPAPALARPSASREYGRLEHFRTFCESLDWAIYSKCLSLHG